MLEIQENISLRELTTFHVGGPARFFAVVKSVDELRAAIAWAKENSQEIFVLGGGSNILVSDAGFNGLVLKMEIGGMEFSDENENGEVSVTVGAGENWDGFVAQTVDRGLAGLENLSYIPGTVGGAAVQNIGAYGVEIDSLIESVEAFVPAENAIRVFTSAAGECGFEYRNSIFKKNPGKYIVTRIIFKLKKAENGTVNISYKDVREFFGDRDASTVTPAEVCEAIIAIRRKKLPDWKTLGTAGSFFKNPVITEAKYAELQKAYPEIPAFTSATAGAGAKVPAGFVKVPLAWILDNICGYRGKQHTGSIGVYQNQALVIVHDYMKAQTTQGMGEPAKASDIIALADEMAHSILEKTGIAIHPEVQYIGFDK
jgi:UDP-N-acetylmuramate dehydrogenase